MHCLEGAHGRRVYLESSQLQSRFTRALVSSISGTHLSEIQHHRVQQEPVGPSLQYNFKYLTNYVYYMQLAWVSVFRRHETTITQVCISEELQNPRVHGTLQSFFKGFVQGRNVTIFTTARLHLSLYLRMWVSSLTTKLQLHVPMSDVLNILRNRHLYMPQSVWAWCSKCLHPWHEATSFIRCLYLYIEFHNFGFCGWVQSLWSASYTGSVHQW